MSPTAEPADLPRHRFTIIAATMAGMFMQMLDTTVANVALPHMRATLAATQETITWVLTSYIIASVVAMPLTGWLVDRYGTKRVLITSVALFTLASILCGAAQNLPSMVLFRIIQGLAGAMLAPISQTVLLDLSRPDERPRMMTVFTQVLLIAPLVGPIVGAYITAPTCHGTNSFCP